MKLIARISASAALLVLLLNATGCAKLQARDKLTKGISAFKAGQYERATGLFQESIQLDPDYPTAKLYLATAYAYQVMPNDPSPRNVETANKALKIFDEMLAANANDLDALKQEASIYRNIVQIDKAKAFEQRIIALDPNDAEANYTIGAIDWTQAYKNAVQILAAQGLTDDGAGNLKKSKDTCAKLVTANSALVDEGIKFDKQAIAINPNYNEAMDFLQLTYRRKADLECGNDDARKADLATADEWVHKSMGARKANEEAKEKKLGGGVSLDEDKKKK